MMKLVLLLNAGNALRKAFVKKRCVVWNCPHEQQRNFKRSFIGMIVRSRAECAGSAATRIFGAMPH